MTDEVIYALERERAWRKATHSMDSGSYCEESSPEFKSAMDVVRLYANLSAALLQHERKGHKFPKVEEKTP